MLLTLGYKYVIFFLVIKNCARALAKDTHFKALIPC